MKAKSVDHISIAVRDLAKARKIYEETLGMELFVEYVSEREKIRVARYYLGDVALELMEPTSPDGDVAGFLEKRGEGVYLVSYRVDDIDKALSELKAKGERLIDDEPRLMKGLRYAFIMPPKETCGVLTEIVDGELDPDLNPSKAEKNT